MYSIVVSYNVTDDEDGRAKVMGFHISKCMKMRRLIPLPVSLNRARGGVFHARKEARLYPALSPLLDHDWLNKRPMHTYFKELCREEVAICLIMIGGTKGPCISARANQKG